MILREQKTVQSAQRPFKKKTCGILNEGTRKQFCLKFSCPPSPQTTGIHVAFPPCVVANAAPAFVDGQQPAVDASSVKHVPARKFLPKEKGRKKTRSGGRKRTKTDVMSPFDQPQRSTRNIRVIEYGQQRKRRRNEHSVLLTLSSVVVDAAEAAAEEEDEDGKDSSSSASGNRFRQITQTSPHSSPPAAGTSPFAVADKLGATYPSDSDVALRTPTRGRMVDKDDAAVDGFGSDGGAVAGAWLLRVKPKEARAFRGIHSRMKHRDSCCILDT